jgi:hypothetical protein
MKTKTVLTTLSIVASTILVGCGGGSSSTTTTDEKQVGTFIDSAVAGTQYTTSSGLSGTTDEYGHFQYRQGDTVELRIGNLILGEAQPNEDGLLTPQDLADNNETAQTLILQILQSLDIDNDPSNGITIDPTLAEELADINTTYMQHTNKHELLHLNEHFANQLDANYDGNIDISAQTAQTHFHNSLDAWENGYYTQTSTSTQYGNGYHGGDHNQSTQNQYIDVTTLPYSTLTQELKDALAYMGDKERLAYDVYTNLYNYHLENSALAIYQLQNIASRSEQEHVLTVQSLVQKYNLTQSDLTIVSTPVSDSNTSFDSMPHDGEYGIEHIQELYDVLYNKGIQSQKDALEVGCMVEVTDIEDLDRYIQMAQGSNASDVEQAFTQLRNASYNHYWAFDQALKTLGYENGCYIPGDALLGENKEGIYPQWHSSNHGH